ncbi:unnamed protein product [Notodromas monacha]|uniref:Menorin-like domain-containing protein n=1 Tax=Notodromas monacha TaxID=399045 RepID=A0A7R9BPJ7_9CRUS|nr:unnamed protein product [Notodromas monacha]CAG0917942.1 unnamed protein product [Notodromas monacha]
MDRLEDCKEESNSSAALDVLNYFSEVDGDASKIVWAHRVNSVEMLEKALKDESVMMLEADILSGTVIGEPSRETAIMSHPPDVESDLSFDRFLEDFLSSQVRKGLKLDFKDFSVVEYCLQKLEQNVGEVNFPLWLNADIIRGPVRRKRDPIDPDAFLPLCKKYFPEATLSVGWTVDVPMFYLGWGAYKMEHVTEMAEALKKHGISQPVTFPVFGLFAHNSIDALRWLLDNVSDSSLTIWGGKADSPYHNRKALGKMRDLLGRHRVYFDVPYAVPD